ncbi:hypothetical protein LguiA_021045 [Lonicera macranthoides]
MERRRLEILKLKLRVFFVHILNDNVVHLAYIYIYIDGFVVLRLPYLCFCGLFEFLVYHILLKYKY